MSSNNNKFSQMTPEQRAARVQEMTVPKPMFEITLLILDNGQVQIGCPEGMQESVRGCAMIIDTLAKAQRVLASKLASLQPADANRIQLVPAGAVPPPIQGH